MLLKNNLEWRRVDFLISDLSVFCCELFGNMDVKKVEEFIVEGGGLQIGGQVWWQGYKYLNFNCMFQCLKNKFFICFGFGILDQ